MKQRIKCLVSAGPTIERLDPVRFLSNRSSGQMGYALANAAVGAGFDVTLVSGPVHLSAPSGVQLINVESAAEMSKAMKEEFSNSDLIIMAAAVADYRPKKIFDHKLKKQNGDFVLELERTEDILASLGKLKSVNQVLVGFAAETEDLLTNAGIKLQKKNLDWIAANKVDIGFAKPTNEITLLGRNGEKEFIPLADKVSVAKRLIQIVSLPFNSR